MGFEYHKKYLQLKTIYWRQISDKNEPSSLDTLVFCSRIDQEQAFFFFNTFIRNVLQKELNTENCILFKDIHRIEQIWLHKCLSYSWIMV
jgi:hypothetical protein